MTHSTPEHITRMLAEVGQETPGARERLLDVVYRELHALASSQMRRERSDHTLQPTALVNEAYLRLLGDTDPQWENRAHFFGAAAEVMRRILIDYARRRLAERRGGGHERVPLGDFADATQLDAAEVLAIDDVLGKLDAFDARKGQIVRLRFFAGLTNEEVAKALDSSLRTVKREWRFAKAWLFREIRGQAGRE